MAHLAGPLVEEDARSGSVGGGCNGGSVIGVSVVSVVSEHQSISASEVSQASCEEDCWRRSSGQWVVVVVVDSGSGNLAQMQVQRPVNEGGGAPDGGKGRRWMYEISRGDRSLVRRAPSP
jgi:hypothetical protein